MNFVLFFIYLSLFSWLLIKIKFVINAGLSPKIVISLFSIKIFTGVIYAVFMMQRNGLSDSLFFNMEGLKEYHLLISHPKQYLVSFFHSGYQNGYGGMLNAQNSYWKDLQGNMIIRFLSVCNIFTRGNYYLNIIFYNFVIFFGAVGLYRVYAAIYPNKKYLLLLACFLLPSILIYSSTIHKEGLIFAAIGIIVYHIYYALNIGRFTFTRLAVIIAAMAFIFLQRNYVLLLMLPAILAWLLSHKMKYPTLITFIIIYFIGFVIFFTGHFLSPKINFPQSLINKQAEFNAFTTAATYIKTDTLQANFSSFAAKAPQAFELGFLRPFFTDIKFSISILPLAIEIFIYELLFLLFIFFRNKDFIQNPFIYFGIFFSISIILVIGYTIPVIGAIVRYRSIYLPFLLTPIISSINWQKIRSIFIL